jgi:hypothetical protein
MGTRRQSSITALLVAGITLLACTAELSQPAPQGMLPAAGNHGSSVGGTGAGGVSTGGASAGRAGGLSHAGSAGSAGSMAGAPPTEPTVFSRTGLAARLSKFEYQHSISDVLGVSVLPAELDASADGIPDDTGDGVFKHIADKQTSIEQHALAYFQVAEAVAKRVDFGALAKRLGTCTDATAACGTATIQALGRLLFRRPLEQRQVDTMLAVFNAGLGEQLDYAHSMSWTLHAMLQMPEFLFRLENETASTSAPRDLDGYELGARLASFLWLSVPDEALLTAAGDGSLLRPEGLDAQIQRMLADPKAQRFTEAFGIDFSRARFASFDGATDADRAALNESMVATFQDHFWTQHGSVAALFTTTRFVVNPTTAALLGMTTTGTGLQPVDVAGLPQRVGLMTHPGMIAGMGDRAIGSFVNRGKYLMERLLCRNPISVPDDIAAIIDTFNADTAGLNEREKSDIRRSRNQCWSCHSQFEPLAFGFSRFDGAGRYVGEKDADGKPLMLDGWVPTGEATEPEYTDVASYMQALASDPLVQTCMTEHFVSFATARSSDELSQTEAEKTIGKEYQANGSTLSAMVSAVAHSALFKTILSVPPAGAGN